LTKNPVGNCGFGLHQSKKCYRRRRLYQRQPIFCICLSIVAASSALRFLATVKPTSDLHRRSTFQPRLPINHRLASAIFLRLCLPTQRPTLADRQILRLAFSLPSNLRWRPTFRPAFQPTFDLRRRPTFRPNLRINLRLAPLANPLVCLPTRLRLAPSIRLPAQPSG